MDGDVKLDAFASRIGEPFRMWASSDRAIDVTLVEARALAAAGVSPAGRAAFSLTFRAAGGELVPQRIYRVEHDGIGSHDIFLVPIGPDGTGMRYEAIFT